MSGSTPTQVTNMPEGRYYDNQGYVRVKVDGVLRLEHRVVMEKVLGRKLADDEVVHHRNEKKDDNRPENLEVMTNVEHSTSHAKRTPPIEVVCPACGVTFARRAFKVAEAQRNGTKMFCSRHCIGVGTGFRMAE